MPKLFILSRAWGSYGGDGGVRTQAMDGGYINALSAEFEASTVALVIADAARFAFLQKYRHTLHPAIKIFPLRQSAEGFLLARWWNRARNLVVTLRGMASATHVAVFMSSVAAVAAALAARLLGRRLLVYSGNDWAADTALNLGPRTALVRRVGAWIADGLETWVLRAADIRLVNSSQLYNKCRSMPGRCERVRPVSLFDQRDLNLRDDTCATGAVNIVYPAAIIPRKNHAVVLKALALLLRDGVNAKLLLAGGVGSNGYKETLDDLAEELCVSERVQYLGYLNNKAAMLDLYWRADVFVLASLNEGFPRVVWEAMLQSLPCAISSIPNVVADIGERDVALLFDPGSERALAVALGRIVSDGPLRRELIRRSREYALEVFSEDWKEQLTRVTGAWR